MQEASVSTERLNGSLGISAVILDYGQVLVSSPTAEEFGRLAEAFNLSFDSFYELWEASRGPYDRGDFSAEEYWLKLAAQTNSRLDRKQIGILRQVEIEIWVHTIPGMLDWVGQLRAKGFKTGLLSNMPWDLVKHVRTKFEWMEKFSFKTLSAEVGMIKPDPAIYEHTLCGLGVSAAQALFIDDREINVRAARTLGMRAIQFRSIAQLKHELEAMGFPVLPATLESSSVMAGPASAEDRPNQEKFSALL
jgi:putative hydrolase of the HAD superfamily